MCSLGVLIIALAMPFERLIGMSTCKLTDMLGDVPVLPATFVMEKVKCS